MERTELTAADIPPIYVSSSGYDDMGSILDRMGIDYDSTGCVESL